MPYSECQVTADAVSLLAAKSCKRGPPAVRVVVSAACLTVGCPWTWTPGRALRCIQ
jgi:hypothetical protein